MSTDTMRTWLQSIGMYQGDDNHSYRMDQANSDRSDSHNSDNHNEATHFITPLTHYGLVSIEGPDSAQFLQGQTTCDIRQIDDRQSVNGAYCSIKGRVLANFHAARIHDTRYLLRMDTRLTHLTLTTWQRYIVFSKAELHNVSTDYWLFGLYGSQAAAVVESLWGHYPQVLFGRVSDGHSIAIQLDSQGQRFECWVTANRAQQYWHELNQHMPSVGSKAWELLNIREGIADITETTSGLFIPQMLNYPQTGVVNFKKGCYTGQEVVARMQYLGKPKRQLVRAVVASDSITAGSQLYGASGTKSIGTVVNAAAIGQQQTELLAVVTAADVEKDQVYLQPGHWPLELLPLGHSG